MLMAHPLTLADVLVPGTQSRGLLRDACLVLGGSGIIALLAQVTIPIGAVPITGQTLGVMLVAAALGARRGTAAVVAYLIEGAGGLPVFSAGGFGASVIFGVTGGYLAGFIPAAWVTGWLAERGWDRGFWSACAAMAVGNALVFACGVPVYAAVAGWDIALTDGLLKFLPLDAGLKVFLASSLLPAVWRVAGRRGQG